MRKKPREGDPFTLANRGINSAFTMLLLSPHRSPPRHVPWGFQHSLSGPAAPGAELLRTSGLPVGEAAPAGLRTLSGQAAEHEAEGTGGPAPADTDAFPGEVPGEVPGERVRWGGLWQAAYAPVSPPHAWWLVPPHPACLLGPTHAVAVLVEFAGAVVTKYPELGSLNNTHLLPHSSRGWEFKIKMSVGLVLSEASFLGV